MEHPAVATNHDGITELIVSGITIPSVKSKRQLHGIPGRGEDVLLPTAQRDDNSLVPVNPPAESFVVKDPTNASFSGIASSESPVDNQVESHVWIAQNVPKLIKANPTKTGLAFLSACKGTINRDDCIEKCTAIERMRYCLETQLGYVVIVVGENVSKSTLIHLMDYVKGLQLPTSFSRVIYYHFGHGDSEYIEVADGLIKRSDIISSFQSLGPQESLFKSFIFDCCRVAENKKSDVVESSQHWVSGGQFPSSSNTLVINATEYDFEAYYEVTSGCGLVTHFFTKFAPTKNESIWELLVSIRGTVVKLTKQSNLTQMLVYEDKLMGKCNLLAESQGIARVVPTGVHASSAVISTYVHFSFDSKVVNNIKEFVVEVSSDSFQKKNILTTTIAPHDRMGIISDLIPDTAYEARVAVVYNDGMTARSIRCTFTTPGRTSPSEIDICPYYPGSSSAKVHWKFEAAISDIDQFKVALRADGEASLYQNVTKDRCGTVLKGFIPQKKHRVVVMAIYQDGRSTEASEEFQHKDLPSPEELKFIPECSGSANAVLKWNFPYPKTDLSHFRVIVKVEGKGIVLSDRVTKEETQHQLRNLFPSKKHKLSVVAVYAAGDEKRSSIDIHHTELQAATIQSVTLIKLRNDESKSVHRIDWSYENDDTLLNAASFRIIATRDPSDGRELPNPFPVTNPNLRTTEIELESGATYSIYIEIHYANTGLLPQTSKEDIKITTPADNDVKPMILIPEESIMQDSATATIREPLILQERKSHACEGLKLISIKYSVVELPQQDGGDGPNSSKSGRKGTFKEFKEPYSPNSQAGSHIQPQLKAIHGLRADADHLITLRAEYSTGDCVESDPIRIHTRHYTGYQKFRCCSAYIGLSFFLSLILLSSLFFCSSFGAYRILLHSSTTCSTEYVLTADSVKCGEVNSLHYRAIQVGGNLQQGDTLLGSLQAWVVKEADLVFYSKKQPSITVTANVSEHQRFLLQGWQIYVWSGSVIYGYCCIINNGIGGDVTAKLFMFTSDSDATNFVNGQGAENSVLSDSIQIPPGKQQCFHSWGAARPFIVSESSYHFIGVDIPGNTTFSYNITVLQKYVNGSDYGSPHYFRYDNLTEFLLPGSLFSDDNYVTICKAPLYLDPLTTTRLVSTTPRLASVSENYKNIESLASNVGSESLHLTSCNKPHHWMDIAFPVALAFGLVFLLIFTLSCSFMCFCMCKYHRNRLYLSCKFSTRSHNGYGSIQ